MTINFIPSFSIAIGFFLIGRILDILSTYALIMKLGLDEFYKNEVNPVVISCVKRFGLIKGLILSIFHFEVIISTVFLLVLTALMYLLFSWPFQSSSDYIASITLAIFTLGAGGVYVSINNFLGVIFTKRPN